MYTVSGRTIEKDAQIFNVRCFGRRAVARLHSSEAKAMRLKRGWKMAVDDAWLCENDQKCKTYKQDLDVGPPKCNRHCQWPGAVQQLHSRDLGYCGVDLLVKKDCNN